MKFIKYIAAALLLTAGIASCTPGGEGSGTPGKTTVQFAQAEVAGGYGAGYVNIPITITADSEQDMNSCNVTVKVKPVITGEEYEGVHDETGKPGAGDYAITSFNLNFPAYSNYYNEKEPEKYFDETTQKWTKTVNLELKIVNNDSDEMRVTFEIEESNTTIGEQKQCHVVLKKTTRDRMCGMFAVAYDSIDWYDGTDPEEYPLTEYAWNAVMISWDNDYEEFVVMADFGLPLFAKYDGADEDGNNGDMIFHPKQPLGLADQAGTAAFVLELWDATTEDWATDWVRTEFDVEKGTITFPENIVLRFFLYTLDSEFNLIEKQYEVLPGYKGIEFTKMK